MELTSPGIIDTSHCEISKEANIVTTHTDYKINSKFINGILLREQYPTMDYINKHDDYFSNISVSKNNNNNIAFSNQDMQYARSLSYNNNMTPTFSPEQDLLKLNTSRIKHEPRDYDSQQYKQNDDCSNHNNMSFHHYSNTQNEKAQQICSRNTNSTTLKHVEQTLCLVCSDVAAGFHCGAYVCEACKKFFVRCTKQENLKFTCQRKQNCIISKETRTQCQFCRYQKCLSLGMYKPGQKNILDAKISNIPCKVCGAASSGYHFGAITCEGCKGFFRRTVRERDSCKYSCTRSGQCSITTATRNMCKYCRYKKCCDVGMNPDGSRIGRQPNSVKYATMLELANLQTDSSIPLPDSVINDNYKSQKHQIESKQISNYEPVAKKGRKKNPSANNPPPLLHFPPSFNSKISMEDLSKILLSSFNELLVICRRDTVAIPVQPPGAEFRDVWGGVMKMFALHAQGVLRFAKKIPGFKEIHVEDQIVIVQSATYQIVMILLALDYDCEKRDYNYFTLSPSEKQTMLATFTPLLELIVHFHEIGYYVQRLEMKDVEVSALCAIVLISNMPENEIKTSYNIIRNMEEIQLSFMNYYRLKTFGKDSDLRQTLIKKLLCELKNTNNQHSIAVRKIKQDHPELTFPQLYVEMFFSDDANLPSGAI